MSIARQPSRPLNVRQFLDAYRSARVDHFAKHRTALPEFLLQLRKLRANVPNVPGARDHEAPSLLHVSTFLQALHRKSAAARASGAFLNVWSIAKLKRDEVRTAAVLAWILDAHGTHGKGNALLCAILDQIKEAGWGDFRDCIRQSRHYRIRTEFCPLGDRSNRVDIALEGNDWILIVEVKIDAPEGWKQIQRYVNVARARAQSTAKARWSVLYVCLTAPKRHQERVTIVRWQEIARAIRAAVASHDHRAFSDSILLQYADHIANL